MSFWQCLWLPDGDRIALLVATARRLAARQRVALVRARQVTSAPRGAVAALVWVAVDAVVVGPGAVLGPHGAMLGPRAEARTCVAAAEIRRHTTTQEAGDLAAAERFSHYQRTCDDGHSCGHRRLRAAALSASVSVRVQ